MTPDLPRVLLYFLPHDYWGVVYSSKYDFFFFRLEKIESHFILAWATKNLRYWPNGNQALKLIFNPAKYRINNLISESRE